MSDHEVLALLAGAVITALVNGFISAKQKRDDELRRETGQRMGALEKANDYRDGYEAGYRQGREEAERKDGQR